MMRIPGIYPEYKLITAEEALVMTSSIPDKYVPPNEYSNDKGIPAASSTAGEYEVIKKEVHIFTVLERITRFVLGLLAICATFTLGLFSKKIRKLFTETSVTTRSIILKDYMISKRELEKGVDTSESTINKLKDYIKTLPTKTKPTDSKSGEASEDGPVIHFELPKSCEGMEFFIQQKKPQRKESLKDRYKNMIHGETVIREQCLSLLNIPNAVFFTIKNDSEEYEVIAQKKPAIEDENQQNIILKDDSSKLDTSLEELTTFILKTGYSNISAKDIHILKGNDDFSNRKFSLVNLAKMEGATIGLYGKEGKNGLLHYAPTPQQKARIRNANTQISLAKIEEEGERLRRTISPYAYQSYVYQPKV